MFSRNLYKNGQKISELNFYESSPLKIPRSGGIASFIDFPDRSPYYERANVRVWVEEHPNRCTEYMVHFPDHIGWILARHKPSEKTIFLSLVEYPLDWVVPVFEILLLQLPLPKKDDLLYWLSMYGMQDSYGFSKFEDYIENLYCIPN